ncbi:hypothetical protein GCK32_017573, partial [Trichostrongylus colubriformis]
SLSANTLADSLGVSPLYKQQDSARWNAAAQVYHNSRAHSPTQDGQFQFSPETLGENMCVNPQQLVTNFIHKSSSVRTPLSLEDIANMNRRRHFQVDLHTRYFRNARELLSFISPDHATRFNECLATKLNELAANETTCVKAS